MTSTTHKPQTIVTLNNALRQCKRFDKLLADDGDSEDTIDRRAMKFGVNEFEESIISLPVPLEAKGQLNLLVGGAA